MDLSPYNPAGLNFLLCNPSSRVMVFVSWEKALPARIRNKNSG